MAKYLYGAAVQGIQSFIFQTNKLKEVIGASEIVKSITDKTFFDLAGITNEYSGLILATAGNIKCEFSEKDKLKLDNIVRNFPRKVMQIAPGITVSQAVVKVDNNDTSDALNLLEQKLRVQRNIPSVPLETGYSILKRARRTGGIVEKDNDDRATFMKLDNGDNFSLFASLSGLKDEEIKAKELSFDMSDITASGPNKWMAVVHADGNGLGNIIQNIGTELTKQGKFSAFSQRIQHSTEEALQEAFQKVITKDKNEFEHNKPGKPYRYPIRPIVIGGDDVTLIIRADLALRFTTIFLKEFENSTKENFSSFGFDELKDGLSACAGIAYIKESYPLYYALDLAEDLTSETKKMVKAEQFPQNGHVPYSGLSFFKVADSFVESLKEMEKRNKKAIQSNVNFNYGPYTISKIKEGIPTVEELENDLKILEEQSTEKSKGVSKIRQLVSESFINRDRTKFMLDRMKTVNSKIYASLRLNEDIGIEQHEQQLGNENRSEKEVKSKLLDLIQLHSFKY